MYINLLKLKAYKLFENSDADVKKRCQLDFLLLAFLFPDLLPLF